MFNRLLFWIGKRLKIEDIPIHLHQRLSHIPELQGVSRGDGPNITVWLTGEPSEKHKKDIPTEVDGIPVITKISKQWQAL